MFDASQKNFEDMKVVHSVFSWLPLTEVWLYNQVCFLPSEVESHIVCERTENLDQFGLPNIHSLSNASKLHYYWDKGLRKLKIRCHLGFLVKQIKRYRIQILHSHFGNMGWANINAARSANVKHVVTFYGLDVNRLPTIDPRWRVRYRTLFSHVDRVLCEGPFMAKCIVKMGCPEDKVQVQHLGVKINEIVYEPRTWCRGEPLRVLIAASFREKKGIPYALEALGHLRKEIPLQITIIGDATSEPRSQAEKKKILDTVKRHSLEDCVGFLGYQPHDILFKEAYKHHIFLSPSVTASDGDTEGGAPVAIIEMMATGMLVVSTRHCDIPEIVKDGETGLLADEGDVKGLTDKLIWLINNPEKWGELTIAGRKHVEKEYDARIQGIKLAGIYRDVLRS